MAGLKVKINGVEVSFQSEDDFARAVGALKRADENGTEKPSRGRTAASAAKPYNVARATAAFLDELVNHPEGMYSNIVAQALQCEPRGIGRRLLEVDDVLSAIGLKRARVYDNSKRLAEGGRMYVPGPDAKLALEAVKQRVERVGG